MAALAESVPIAADDGVALLQFARERQIGLVVVGPEAPLAHGLADDLCAAGLAVFGPGRAGAQLEASKTFAKEVMERAKIPTARHATFTDLAAAHAYVERQGAPVVVKADGLAAGKGVTVAKTLAEARQALDDAMERRVFGDAGSAVVIEDYLEGAELSVMALLSGETYRLLPPAQDHKAAFDGDQGPNTGGMGAFAPVPWANGELLEAVQRRIFDPLVAELAHSGIDYRGALYAGLMVTREGPQVIEFNVRFGDPEAQVILPLLEADLLDACIAVANGTLEGVALAQPPGWRDICLRRLSWQLRYRPANLAPSRGNGAGDAALPCWHALRGWPIADRRWARLHDGRPWRRSRRRASSRLRRHRARHLPWNALSQRHRLAPATCALNSGSPCDAV
jgi:phosphoribosylamine--glycine ligase